MSAAGECTCARRHGAPQTPCAPCLFSVMDKVFSHFIHFAREGNYVSPGERCVFFSRQLSLEEKEHMSEAHGRMSIGLK